MTEGTEEKSHLAKELPAPSVRALIPSRPVTDGDRGRTPGEPRTDVNCLMQIAEPGLRSISEEKAEANESVSSLFHSTWCPVCFSNALLLFFGISQNVFLQ